MKDQDKTKDELIEELEAMRKRISETEEYKSNYKLTEKTLEFSKESFKRFAENAQDMLYRMSIPDGKYEYVSQASISVFGYTQDEFYNNPKLIQKAIHPDWKEYFEQEWINLTLGTMPKTYEYQIIHKSGETKWVHQRNVLVYNDDRKPIAIEGIVTDITEKKELELLLQREKVNAQTYLDIAGSILVALDKNGNIILMNKKGYETLGYKGENLLGSNWFDLVIPENIHPEVKGVFEKIMIGEMENVEYFENQVVTKSGELRDIAWHNTNILDNKGKIVSLLSSGEDITDRKKTEKDFLNIFQHLKAAEGIAELGYYENNLSTGEIYWSEGMIKLLGYKRNEIETNAESFIELIHPDDKDVEIEKIQNAIKTEDKFDSEFRFIKKNKDVGWIYTIGETSSNEQGELVIKGVLQEITKRKQAENHLIQSEAQFKSIFSEAPLGIEYYDFEGELVDANKECLNIFGVADIKEIKGFKLFEDPNLSEESIKQVKEGNPYQYETEFDFELVKKHNLYQTSKTGKCFLNILITPYKVSSQTEMGYLVHVEDITKRKQVEEDLKNSEDRYKNIVDNLLVGIAIHTENKIMFVNDSLLNMMGYNSDDQFLGKNAMEFVHADDQERVMKVISLAVSHEGSVDEARLLAIENRLIKADGSEIIVEASGIKINYYGEVALMVMINDITEQKLAKEQLLESEERYRGLSKASFEAIFISEKGICIEQNSTAEIMFGYSLKEAVGKKGTEWIVEKDRELVMSNILSGYEDPYEITALRKDDSTFPAEIQARVMKYRGREVRVTALNDITQRKSAEDRLKESEEKLRLVWENSVDGMRLTNEEGMVVLVNEAYCKLMEKPRKEIERKMISDVYEDSKKEDILIKHKDRFQSRSIPKYLERNIILWNNKKISLELSNSFLEIPDQPSLSLSIFRDVTEQKKAQEELKQAFKELEKSKLQLRELNIHSQNIREDERTEISREIHDSLGQALTALKMDLAWIQKKSKISNVEVLSKFDEMKGLIDETTSSVQKISTELRPGLLDDLGLTYALDWQCHEFEKRTEIKSILKLKPKDIVLSENISVALFRIVQESLTNVVRHAKATEVVVTLAKEKEFVELKISDNGIGINKENRENPKSLGLLGITERVYAINGEVSFLGKKEGGTEVKVIVPFENEDANK